MWELICYENSVIGVQSALQFLESEGNLAEETVQL